MNYTLIRNPRSKQIKIKISINGEISLVAPMRTSVKTCDRFYVFHETWITKTLEKVHKKQLELENLRQDMRGKVMYLGNTLELKIDENLKQKYLLDNDVLISRDSNLEYFYKTEARRIFEAKCAQIAPFYGVTYKKIRIGAPKSRWGSYSSSGTISLNYNLIKTPHSIIEYVIIHELCHILHPNHSIKFWNEVSKLCSNFKQKRAWLRENQTKLSL